MLFRSGILQLILGSVVLVAHSAGTQLHAVGVEHLVGMAGEDQITDGDGADGQIVGGATGDLGNDGGGMVDAVQLRIVFDLLLGKFKVLVAQVIDNGCLRQGTVLCLDNGKTGDGSLVP